MTSKRGVMEWLGRLYAQLPKQCTLKRLAYQCVHNHNVLLKGDGLVEEAFEQWEHKIYFIIIGSFANPWHELLRSEIPSGICAKLRTVAASSNRIHMPWSLYYCLSAPHICMVLFFTLIPFVVNHTFNATSPERFNNIPSFLQGTAPIARSLCEGWTPHDLHILVTAPFCWSVSHFVTHKHERWIWFTLSYAMMKALLRLAAVRDTKQAGELRGDTAHFIASCSALVLMMQNGSIDRPLTQTETCLLRWESSKHTAENSEWIRQTITRSRHYWRKEPKYGSAR